MQQIFRIGGAGLAIVLALGACSEDKSRKRGNDDDGGASGEGGSSAPTSGSGGRAGSAGAAGSTAGKGASGDAGSSSAGKSSDGGTGATGSGGGAAQGGDTGGASGGDGNPGGGDAGGAGGDDGGSAGQAGTGAAGSGATGGSGGSSAGSAGNAGAGGSGGALTCDPIVPPETLAACTSRTSTEPIGGTIPAGRYELAAHFNNSFPCYDLYQALEVTPLATDSYAAKMVSVEEDGQETQFSWTWTTDATTIDMNPTCETPSRIIWDFSVYDDAGTVELFWIAPGTLSTYKRFVRVAP